MPAYLKTILYFVFLLSNSLSLYAQNIDLNVLPSISQILNNDGSEKEKYSYGTSFRVGLEGLEMLRQEVRIEVGVHHLDGTIKTQWSSPGGAYRFDGQMQNTGFDILLYPFVLRPNKAWNVNLGLSYSKSFMKEDGMEYIYSVLDLSGTREQVKRRYNKNVWSPALQIMYRPGAENGNFNLQYNLCFNQLGSKRILLHSVGFGLAIN